MKRKPRIPKPVYLNAVQRAIESSGKLPAHDQVALRGIVQAALEAFRTGHGDDPQWRDLADALNTAEALAQLRIVSDHLIAFEAGQQALFDVQERHADTGSWTLRAAELVALDTACWLHGIQLEHCSLGEYQKAQQRVRNRVRAELGRRAAAVERAAA